MLLSNLGRSHVDPAVVSILSELGLRNSKIKLKRGESDVALDAPAKGVDVVFSDPSLHDVPQNLPQGALILSAIFFFSEGIQGHRQFQGLLPYGLSFGMKRDEVRKMLGAPEWTSPLLPIDRWVTGSHRTIIYFADSSEVIQYVNCSLPER